MTFGQSVKTVYSKYVTFSGRASRSEFWWFNLFFNLVYIALYIAIGASAISSADGQPSLILLMLLTVFALGSILPAISVMVRRLHDLNKSGWWYWFALIPLIGVIMLLVWFCTKGTEGNNDFGTDPLGGAGAEVFA